jgi:hypothetical protein
MVQRKLALVAVAALAVGLLAADVVPAAASTVGSAEPLGPHSRAAAEQRLERLRADSLARQGAGQFRPQVGPAALAQLVGPGFVFVEFSANGGLLFWHSWITGKTTLLPNSNTLCPDEPRPSPDGLHVVYVEFSNFNCDGTTKLIVIDLSTGTLRIIATAPAGTFFEEPNFSHDSSTILYSRILNDGSDGSLFTIPEAGGPSSAIGGEGLHAADGVYSPDGTEIAYAAQFNTTADFLAIMQLDGTLVRNLPATAIGLFSPSFPAWSPDGSMISYSYVKSHPAPRVYTNGLAVTRAEGTGNHKLPVTGAADSYALISSWSADSTEIIFDRWTINTTTGNLLAPVSIYGTNVAGTYRTLVVAGTASVDVYSPSLLGPGPSTGSQSTFTAVTPARVQPRVPVGPNTTLMVQVAGGSSPVPLGATAVTLNLTGVSANASTYLQVYPEGTPKPLGSNLNLVAGQTAAVAVQVAVPPSGFIRVYNMAGTVGVIVDVDGYFTADTTHAGFVPLSQPTRVLDQTIAGPGSQDVTVTGVPGAPANAVAVVLNLTAAGPTAATYESVVPSPLVGTPAVSNLNVAPKQTRANLVTVPIGTSGQITVFNSAGSVRTIADVVGFYTSDPGHLGYYPLAPTRVLDTRSGTNTANGSTAPIGPGRFIDLPVVGTTTTQAGTIAVPAGAQVAVLSVTAVNPTASTYLTVYATGLTTPLASNINAAKGTVVPNLVLTALGTAGRARIFNKVGDTAVLADLAGYYAP